MVITLSHLYTLVLNGSSIVLHGQHHPVRGRSSPPAATLAAAAACHDKAAYPTLQNSKLFHHTAKMLPRLVGPYWPFFPHKKNMPQVHHSRARQAFGKSTKANLSHMSPLFTCCCTPPAPPTPPQDYPPSGFIKQSPDQRLLPPPPPPCLRRCRP